MKIEIRIETLKEILYFLNWFLRHMNLGGGGSADYNRLSRLIWKLRQQGILSDLIMKEFPSLRGCIRNFERMQEIEKEK